MKHSLAELIQLADSENITMGRAALADQVEQEKATERAVYDKMLHAWNVMKESVVGGMDPNIRSLSGLTGGQASKLKAQAESGNSVGGEVLGKATANALAVAELNAAMGRIVAAPTAGACGIIPGALTSAMERFGLDDETIVDALFCAAGVGAVIAHRASISGAEGGCQAECGSAAAMAAAALTQIKGGTPTQCANACAFALMNLMGLVCDPVQGLVEIPCVYRNVIGVAAAFTASDLALANCRLPLDPDDIIDTMGKVGRSLPMELRETGRGGCATCPVRCTE